MGRVQSAQCGLDPRHGFDRPILTTFPDSSTEAVTSYNANSSPLVRRTRSAATVTLTYDTLNRLTSKAPAGQNTVSYAYDLTGRITSVSDAAGAFAYAGACPWA